MSPSSRSSRFLRCLVAAASGFLFTVLFLGTVAALREYSAENWGTAPLRWLALDFWARQFPLKAAVAGGGLTLILALAGEFLRIRALDPLLRVPRFGVRLFGGGVGFGVLLVMVLLPRGLARVTRPAAPADAPNVLIVLVDTWRADHSSFLGYERDTWPGIDALAKEGVVFERAMSQAPWTKPSVGALFTSLVPSKHGAMSHASRQTNYRFVAMDRKHLTLAESLDAAGYETAAIVMNANVQPEYGFDQGFRTFHYISGWTTRDRDMVGYAEHWLHEERPDNGRPFFLYLHLTDPHYPYEPLPPFAGKWDHSGSDFNLDYDTVKAIHEGKTIVTPELRDHLRDAYDEEMLGTDSVLAPFLRKVREENPNTIVVLVGDHGDEFLEHGMIGHGHQLYDELLHVPLLFWAPNLRPLRVGAQVRLIDVFPTVLDLAGVPLPDGPRVDGLRLMGRSLRALLEGQPGEDRPAPAETGGDGEPHWQLRSLCAPRDGQLYKMIRQEIDPEHPRAYFMLYNLTQDPGEQHDLAKDHPELVQRMFSEMKENGWYTAPEDLEGEVFKGKLGKKTAANLEALGYIGGEEDQ